MLRRGRDSRKKERAALNARTDRKKSIAYETKSDVASSFFVYAGEVAAFNVPNENRIKLITMFQLNKKLRFGKITLYIIYKNVT